MPPRRQAPQQRVVKRKLRNSRSSESPGEEHRDGQLPSNECSPPDRKRVRRSSVRMDQPVPQVGYPHPQQQQAPQQMMNGGIMGPVPGPMPGGPMNFPPDGPLGMTNPGVGTPMGPQIPGNTITMSPGMGGPRAPNMMQMRYDQGVHAVTKRLAMSNLPGGRAGTPTPGEPPAPFNQGPGPGQTQFPGSQNDRLGRKKRMGMIPPPSPAGGPPKEQPKDVKLPGPNGAEGSPQNHPSNLRTGGHGPPNAGGGAQVSTAPPTPGVRSSSITASSPSTVVNGKLKIKPAVAGVPRRRENRRSRRRVEPEAAGNFLTTEFMQSVASTLEDFDTQTLSRSKDTGNSEYQGINFEEFREWFNPDDLT